MSIFLFKTCCKACFNKIPGSPWNSCQTLTDENLATTEICNVFRHEANTLRAINSQILQTLSEPS